MDYFTSFVYAVDWWVFLSFLFFSATLFVGFMLWYSARTWKKGSDNIAKTIMQVSENQVKIPTEFKISAEELKREVEKNRKSIEKHNEMIDELVKPWKQWGALFWK